MPVQPYLATPTATTEILRKYDLRTQKKYGQNFLIDAHIPAKIADSAEITEEDCILEIGPGIGTLTQFLAQKSGKVIAVELDDKLIPVLGETLAGYENVQILHADILKVDLQELIEKEAGGRTLKVVANLPYYITTPILMTMLEARLPALSYTLMVQKEVADRMQARPGTKDYGALTLAVQYYTKPEVIMHVAPGCFLPQPKVGSTVIRLAANETAWFGEGAAMQSHQRDARAWSGHAASLNSQSSLSDGGPPTPAGCDSMAAPSPAQGDNMLQGRDACAWSGHAEKTMFKIIRAAFQQRRKTLANALKNSAELSYSREQIEEAISACGFRPDVRGEALSLEEFQKLARAL